VLFTKAFNRAGEFSLAAFEDLAGFGARNLLDITVFEAAGNSARNAIVAATIALAVGTLTAWLLARTTSRWPELLFMLPLGVSSVVLGFGYLLSFGGEPLPLRQSWLVVPLVQALITTPLVVRIVYAAIVSLGINTREAAVNAGADSWQIWRFIETPSIRPALATALGFALLSSLGEFGSSALLAYSDQATLPVVLMRLISRPGEQNYSMAMATSVLLVLIVLALVAASELIRTRRRQLRDA
jgi:thiamine transport system permease protein